MDPEMIDGHMMWVLLQHIRRQARQQVRRMTGELGERQIEWGKVGLVGLQGDSRSEWESRGGREMNPEKVGLAEVAGR